MLDLQLCGNGQSTKTVNVVFTFPWLEKPTLFALYCLKTIIYQDVESLFSW